MKDYEIPQEIEKAVAESQALYKRVFDNPEGRLVLEDLAKRCSVNTTTLNENHGIMCFAEGRRSIYTHIVNMVQKDIKEILEDLTKTKE